MTIFGKKLSPNEVFTPRARDINEKMYVNRPDLERRLVEALKGDKYIIVHGESGNGKTWLYKRVLASQDIYYQIVNLANANLHGSLLGAFEAKLSELGYHYQAEYNTEIDTGIKPGGVGASYKDQNKTVAATQSAFAALLKEIRRVSGTKPAVLVLDNFEQIVDNDQLLKSVASIIISADEEAIAALRVKILIVGVPRNLGELVAKVGNASTISNRLIEIPEVARMTLEQAISLRKKGFEEQLRFDFSLDKAALYKDICWKTDKIAQHIHELCLKIALEAEYNKNVITEKTVQSAEKNWLEESFLADFGVIQNAMNSIETKVGRKNQILYCLGKCSKEDFHHSEIDKIVREEFNVESSINLGLQQMLAAFSKMENPIIRRAPKGNSYRFASPKLRMAIRAGLRKTGDRVLKYTEV